MRKTWILSWLTAVLCIASASAKDDYMPVIFNGVDRTAMNQWVDSVMNTMATDEKIGQLVVVQLMPSTDATNKAWLRKMVEQYHIGGLLYTKGTLREQAELTNYAQSLARVPLLMTLDGEWGLAMRFTDAIEFPRNMVLGAIDDDRLLYAYGQEVARQCRRAGLHVNFAPVLDVNDNPANPVIGTRSYGENPELVARHGIAYARGLEDGGVLSVVKHFPGHGNTSTDSHKTLPLISKSLSELKICEFEPFRQYIDARLSGVMVGHLQVPAIFKEDIPSSLSPKVVTDLLQGEMGFNGLIFTDGLAMKGVTRESDMSVKALLAGNDILLGPANVTGEIATLKSAVQQGRLSKQLIDERCRKVLQYKYALGLNHQQRIDTKGIAADINSGKAEALCNQLWAAAMTVVKNEGDVLPIGALDSTRVAVLSLGGKLGLNSMFQNRCRDYADTEKFEYYDGMSVERLAADLSQYDVVIIAAGASDKKYATVMDQLTSRLRSKVVGVMMMPAYRVARFSKALSRCQAVVVAYDDCRRAQDFAAQTVFGGNAASGRLPVSINGVAPVGEGCDTRATRLGYGVPAQAGFLPGLEQRIDSLVQVGLRTKAFPGCQVLVARHGQVVINKAFGDLDYKSGQPVTTATIYDLASVTKGTGTMAGIMRAYDEGKLDVDACIGQYIPQLKGTGKERITLRQLLYHESGMPAYLNMFDVAIDTASYSGKLFNRRKTDVYTLRVERNMYGHRNARLRTDITSKKPTEQFPIAIAEGIYGGRATYDTIMQRIYDIQLKKPVYRYSCLNFCLLMQAEENATGVSHDQYVELGVFVPLGAYHTLYRPLRRYQASDIAPTEQDNMLRRQTLQGYVHDETAAFSGGVQGNAGLFSNANDLAKMFQMWLNGGEYGGQRYLKSGTLDLFCGSKSGKSRRGLGFDKPDKENEERSPTCPEASAATFGHIGFTGTCFWIDPESDLIYIFLSNKVNPTRENRAFKDLDIRPSLMSIIYQSMEI